jgi:putative oxidoreductase
MPNVTAPLMPLARLLFATIFLYYGPYNFNVMIGPAAQQGVPMANVLVPIAGVIALVGAVSVVLGWKARVGGLLLVLFLLPATFIMHRFWSLEGAQAQAQFGNFIRNLSLLGGALYICHFGAGPYSVDAASERSHHDRLTAPAKTTKAGTL